jgi:hypothetical protein
MLVGDIVMRSIKELYGSIEKVNMVIGEYYGILLCDTFNDSNEHCEWLFRFVGFNDGGSIKSDITYFKDNNGYWHDVGDNSSILCYDNEIIDGSIRKYSKRKVKEKLTPR